MDSIIDYAPSGYSLFPYQISYLQEIQQNIDQCDVLILDADTGSGKSVILQTLARFLNKTKKLSVATITPKVQLQDQYAESFTDVPVLKGAARYTCAELPELNCQEKREILGACESCKFTAAKKGAEESDNVIFNFHSYVFNKITKDVVIVDEAHNIYSVVSELLSLSAWKHIDKYPNNLNSYTDVINWLEQTIKELAHRDIELHKELKGAPNPASIIEELKLLKNKFNKYKRVLDGVRLAPVNYFIEHVQERYHGKMHDKLSIRPTTLDRMPPLLWNKNTKKVVLASGTISKLDIAKLGLSHKRVKVLTMKAPIAAQDRPIQCEFAGNMSYQYQDKNMPALYEKLKELQERHTTTKGIVHIPYNMALKLKALDKSRRFIYHTKEDKDSRFNEFLNAPPGTVLIASGMDEGIDLAGAGYQWQAIAKIQYPSKLDKLVEEWYKTDPSWVTWITARTLMQQCGRINRKQGDYGVTYILDAQFGNPVKKRWGFFQQCQHMLPTHFKERIKWA
jgi:Rad3-related DNA helicase